MNRADHNGNLPSQSVPNKGLCERQNDSPFSKKLIIQGILIIVCFLTGLGFWSFLAPIESAVVAPGIVSVGSNHKTIQHLEGGIVQAILIHEGDKVYAGDILIRLQNTREISQRNQLNAQYFEALATVARLTAEFNDKAVISFPDELINNKDDQAAQVAIGGQQSIFNSRERLHDEQLSALTKRITSFSDEIKAIKNQIKAGHRQKNFISEELKLLKKASRLKLVDKTKVLQLESKKAQTESDISEMQISMAKANQGILETQLNMTEMKFMLIKETDEELRVANASLYELHQQLITAEDILSRTEIHSNIDGTVVGLKVHTVGGVITAGEPLLDIVPLNDELVVEASIDLRDIDQVKTGLPAHVELTSFNRRSRKLIDGEVKIISADSIIDPMSGQAYYKARIELSKESILANNITLQPGMGAEVMIRTGSRTPIDYLLTPITRSMGRALREE